MREIALYYPYIHIRDDNWLKAAALYWPRLARLAPPGYPQRDTDVAQVLDGELNFLINVEPPPKQVADACDQFLTFVRANHEQIYRSYGGGGGERPPIWDEAWQEMTHTNTNWCSSNGGWIHDGETTSTFRDELVSLGLAIKVGHRGECFFTHPILSSAYTMTLVDRIAESNDLAVVTDQAKLHQVHKPGAREELARTLLYGDSSEAHVGNTDDISMLYAEIAVETVVPSNLDSVPVHRIVKARRKLAAEFDAFWYHIDSLKQEFDGLAKIESESVLRARLQLLVDRDIRRPTAALQHDLRALGLEPAKAVLGLKSLEMPTAAAAATVAAAGVPTVVGQAGLITAQLVAGGLQARSKQRAARRASAAGYLLGLKQTLRPHGIGKLRPSSLSERLRTSTRDQAS